MIFYCNLQYHIIKMPSNLNGTSKVWVIVMSHVIPCHNPCQLPTGAFISPIHLHNCMITANICGPQEPHLCPTPCYSLMIILAHQILSIPFHDIPESPEAQVLFMPPELSVLVARCPYVSFFSILRILTSYPLSLCLL